MLTNYWYIGCGTVQLNDAPYASTILEDRIVIFRNRDGKACALKDRCCHRGFPLSQGKLSEGNLVCGFHGWNYESSGQCIKIPSQEPGKNVSKTCRVPIYPCVEKDGYVWVWIGDREPQEVPSIVEFQATKWIQGSRTVNCDFLRALEITFDIAHVYFVHPTHPATMAAGKVGFSLESSELRLTENGCAWLHPLPPAETNTIPEYCGRMEFSLPGRIHFAWPSPAGEVFMNFHVIPMGEGKCRIEYLVQNHAPESPQLQWSNGPSEIMDEDARTLEAIQLVYEREGEDFERSVEADAPPLMLRRIVRMAQEGKWQGLQTDLPSRRTISSMMPRRYGASEKE